MMRQIWEIILNNTKNFFFRLLEKNEIPVAEKQ